MAGRGRSRSRSASILQLVPERVFAHANPKGRNMKKWRRAALVVGLLTVAAAVAVPTALLTSSSARSLKRGVLARHADAPAIGKLADGRETKRGDELRTFAEEDYANRAYPSANVNYAQVQAAHEAAMRIDATSTSGSVLKS